MQITSPDRFDFMYYLIHNINPEDHDLPNEVYSISLLKQAADTLYNYFSSVIKNILQFQARAQQQEMSSSEKELLGRLRKCFQMSIFLIFYYLHNTVIKKARQGKEGMEDEEDSGNEKRGPKQISPEFDALIVCQRSLIKLLFESFQIDFKFLWNMQLIGFEFFRYYQSICLRLFQSKCLCRNLEIQSILFQILDSVILFLNSEQKLQLQYQLNDQVYTNENSVEVIANYLIHMQKDCKQEQKLNLTEILRQLIDNLMRKTDFAKEQQEVKNSRDFLNLLSQHIPVYFHNNLTTFLILYDSESYVLRNSISDIIKNVIINEISANNQHTPNTEENDIVIEVDENKIEKLFACLEMRLYDKHAYARLHTLDIISELVERNLLPYNLLKVFLSKSIEKIKDISAFVRKKALQLVQRIIISYQMIYTTDKSSYKFVSIATTRQRLAQSQKQVAEIQ